MNSINGNDQIKGFVGERQMGRMAHPNERLHVLDGIGDGILGNINTMDLDAGNQTVEIVHHETLGTAHVQNTTSGPDPVIVAEHRDNRSPKPRIVSVAAIPVTPVPVEILLSEQTADAAVL